MSGLLNNALTGLLAAQAGLRTASNNTANVNTEGYSRQRINQAALPGQTVGNYSIGNGVVVNGVERVFDQFLVDQLRSATTLEKQYTTFNDFAARIDSLLGDTEFGVSPAIQDFLDQLQTVAHDPTSIVNRQLLISQGGSLQDRIRDLALQLKSVDGEINRRLSDTVATINTTANAIARLNDKIVAAGSAAGNDLLDQREQRLSELSQLIDINTVETPEGAINVLVGNGRPLVLVSQNFELAAVPDEFDPSRLQVAHVVGARTDIVSRQISGGTLGGLLTFRSEALDPAERELGLVAFTLAEAFNVQHALGVDLNGDLGGDFFATVDPVVTSASSNAGTASATAVVADASQVVARDYEMLFNGSSWQISDSSTGQLLSMSGTGVPGDPFVVDGMEILVTAGAAAGDRFQIRPVTEAASQFRVAISDPAKIAAASPIDTSLSLQNVGNATISGGRVDDLTNPSLLSAVDIVFDDPSTYRIYDSLGTDLTGPLAYASGDEIAFNGWTVTIDGEPSAGDSFSVGPAEAGSGDNGNVVALTDIRNRGFLAGGQTSLNDVIGDMIASIGGAALQSSQQLSAQTALRQQLDLEVQSVSGVNLDEEAVNALRYQEAFMASSKIVALADSLFVSILDMVQGR